MNAQVHALEVRSIPERRDVARVSAQYLNTQLPVLRGRDTVLPSLYATVNSPKPLSPIVITLLPLYVLESAHVSRARQRMGLSREEEREEVVAESGGDECPNRGRRISEYLRDLARGRGRRARLETRVTTTWKVTRGGGKESGES